jgi:hypothetical protein
MKDELPPLSSAALALIAGDADIAGPPPRVRRQIWRGTTRALATAGVLLPSAAAAKIATVGAKVTIGISAGTKAIIAIAISATVAGTTAGVMMQRRASVARVAAAHVSTATQNGRAPTPQRTPDVAIAPPLPPLPPVAAVPEVIAEPTPVAPARVPVVAATVDRPRVTTARTAGGRMPGAQSAGAERTAGERHLLDDALAALGRRDFAAARQNLDRHTSAFPGGRLAEERDALLVFVFAAQGDGTAARFQAAHFRARYPGSVFQRGVAAALADLP